jgi:hypothetical protein
MLEEDAKWLYQWGDGWTLAAGTNEVTRPGTLVILVGSYDFTSPQPLAATAMVGTQRIVVRGTNRYAKIKFHSNKRARRASSSAAGGNIKVRSLEVNFLTEVCQRSLRRVVF